MNFKRYNESDNSWTDSHYIMGTDTDTLTTLPAVIYPNDTSVTVGLKGNMSQTGTPSPTTPIQPSECGDRTENLFNYKTAYSSYLTDNDIVIAPSDMITKKNYFTAEEIGKTLTISAYAKNVTSNRVYIAANINSSVQTGNSIYADSQGALSLTVTPTSTNDYFVLSYGSGGTYNTFNNMMLVEGSTVPSEYIPFGYKIPISSANTTTPVYLGEVESTRNIKQLVLTGQENFTARTNTSHSFQLPITRSADNIRSVSSHYKMISSNQIDVVTGFYAIGSFVLIITDLQYSNVTDFKSYLAAQYAAGTPVTVWYVLATPETGIVNEPLRKIGDYADEVSGITIPTIAGANSFDVLTTLKPSEVTVNYKGWHTGAVHERDSGQWD